jgi:hypothetical protein
VLGVDDTDVLGVDDTDVLGVDDTDVLGVDDTDVLGVDDTDGVTDGASDMEVLDVNDTDGDADGVTDTDVLDVLDEKVDDDDGDMDALVDAETEVELGALPDSVCVGDSDGIGDGAETSPDTMPLTVATPCSPLFATATPLMDTMEPVARSEAVMLVVNGATVSLPTRVEDTCSSR